MMDEPIRIEAAAATPPDSFTLRAASVDVHVEGKAGDGEAKRPTFDIVGYTGAPMNIEGFFSPIILDLTGMRAASQAIPALFAHDPERIVGQTDRVAIAEDVRFSGPLTGENDWTREVISQTKNGFRWQASAGWTINRRELLEAGKTATVNGRSVTGPMWLIRESTIREISFVAIGADGQTTANVAASQSLGTHNGDHPMNFDQWVAAKGFDPATLSDVQRTSLKAAFDADVKAKAATDGAGNGAGSNAGNGAGNAGNGANNGAAAPTQTLDSIFAEQRLEEKRVKEITRIVAQAVADVRLSRPELIDVLELEARGAIQAKTDPRTFELELLRKTRNIAGPSNGGAFNIHAHGDPRANGKTIEAAVCRSAGLKDVEKHYEAQTLEAGDRAFRSGVSLQEIIGAAARDNGWTGHSVRSDMEDAIRCAFPPRSNGRIQAQGWSTYTLATLLGNVANKFLAQGFNAVEQTWRMIADRKPVNDFKGITTAALTGGFTFEKVGGGGELKHATVSELTYTNQAETYGKMFSITRKDIINDDLGVFDQIRTKLGRGGALGLNRDFWTVFLNNSAFFTSGRANLASGAGTVLSLASLAQAQALFRNQTDPDGDPVAIEPAILLVPNALEVVGYNMVNQTQLVNDTTANTQTFMNNPFAGKYKIAQSSYLSNTALTGNSTTAWYLLADPADLAVIQVVFLNGKEVPTVESADADFNVLGIQMRAFYDYGINTVEYRGGVKMAGA